MSGKPANGKAKRDGPGAHAKGLGKGARRRKEVLEVATELFYERGFDSTRTQDIGDQLGLLKGSLYHYIDTKEDLLFEIVVAVHDAGLKKIEELQRQPMDALSKLRVVIEAGIQFVASHRREIRIFIVDGRALSKERQVLLQKERKTYGRYVEGLILAGQAEGEICPDIDSSVARTVVVGITNWICFWYRDDGRISPNSLASQYADLILNGLKCDRSSHVPGHLEGVGMWSMAASGREID